MLYSAVLYISHYLSPLLILIFTLNYTFFLVSFRRVGITEKKRLLYESDWIHT
jgi:hypothetical protein